jgi:integrase
MIISLIRWLWYNRAIISEVLNVASGSWKKEANGTYTIVVDVGVNGLRKQKKKRGIKTKKEAETLITKILSEVNEGNYIDPSKLKLEDYLHQWLDTKQGNMTRLTIDSYKSYIANHIAPSIGSKKLSELSPLDIQTWIATLRKKELEGVLSDSTIQRIFNVLITALNNAKKINLVKENVAKLVDKPKIKKRKLIVWDANEAKKFLREMYNHRHYICFHLALTTGMRQGEILGLTWGSIDFPNKLIRVVQTLEHDAKGFKEGAKSISGVRSITINDNDIAELKRHMHKLEEEKELAGEMYQEHDLVVRTSIGKPVFADTIGKMFRREVRRLNLTPIRFHDLRHSHASLLLIKGIHPKVVSERLGHASVTITLDTYSHLLPNMQEEATKGIADLLF